MKFPFLAIGFCLLSSSAIAAVSLAQETAANQLLSSGKAIEAYQLLRPLIDESDSTQTWALLGKSAEMSGDKDAAISAYRKVLERDLNANRIKLDLAKLLVDTSDSNESERLFREVRSINPPANVRSNIDRYLVMLNVRERIGSAFRVSSTITAGYDSNANQATSAQVVTMFGLPFTLSADAQKRGSAFINAKLELDHIYRFNSDLAWISTFDLGIRKYAAIDNIDNYSFYAATGPVWQPGKKTTITFPFYTSFSLTDNDKSISNKQFYSSEFGIAPQIRYALYDNLDLNLTGTLSRRYVFEQNNRDSTVANLTAGIDFKTTDFGTFSAGASAGKEASSNSLYSNHSLGANLGWQYNLTEKCATAFYTQYLETQYKAKEIAYDVIRQDERIVGGADLVCNIEALGADLTISYQHTENDSNLPIYTYDKDLISASFVKKF